MSRHRGCRLAPRESSEEGLGRIAWRFGGITGIGPQFAGSPHENGVFQFEGIAAWTAGEIACMNGMPSQMGRRERDGRVAQAANPVAEQECKAMAHKKAGGSSRNGRDSAGRRLGVKLFGGQAAIPGNIIVRQRGTKWWPGDGVGMGRDHTIFATAEGRVNFRKGFKGRTYISVLPAAKAAE